MNNQKQEDYPYSDHFGIPSSADIIKKTDSITIREVDIVDKRLKGKNYSFCLRCQGRCQEEKV